MTGADRAIEIHLGDAEKERKGNASGPSRPLADRSMVRLKIHYWSPLTHE